jgi:hypothetical protein
MGECQLKCKCLSSEYQFRNQAFLIKLVCKHGKTKYPIQIWKVGVKEWIKGKPGHPRLLREDEAGSV